MSSKPMEVDEDSSSSPAELVAFCDAISRPGYGDVKAHEFIDRPQAMQQKVDALWRLIKSSKNMVVYSGAGLSTASGISDYATKAENSVVNQVEKPHLASPWMARPTFTHMVLAHLARTGRIKKWVQQNHDGLPQKAGVPQHVLNEIHGAWYDPTNPVVPMSGDLRSDLFNELLCIEQEADLVLTLGTSLSGMNADRVATSCAKRKAKGVKGALGTVIIGLQKTGLDDAATIRIYGLLDKVFELLKEKIEQEEECQFETPPAPPTKDHFTVPYDTNGNPSKTETQTLDLSNNAEIRVTRGPFKDCTGFVERRDALGHFVIVLMVPKSKTNPNSLKVPISSRMGFWWPVEAEISMAPYLPVVNK